MFAGMMIVKKKLAEKAAHVLFEKHIRDTNVGDSRDNDDLLELFHVPSSYKNHNQPFYWTGNYRKMFI